MNHDDEIKAAAQGEGTGMHDCPKLPLEPVAHYRSFEAAACPESDPGRPLVIGQCPDGQRWPVRPSPPSVDRAEGVGQLESRLGGNHSIDALEGLGWNELPASFPSTAAQRVTPAPGAHALQKPVSSGSPQV